MTLCYGELFSSSKSKKIGLFLSSRWKFSLTLTSSSSIACFLFFGVFFAGGQGGGRGGGGVFFFFINYIFNF